MNERPPFEIELLRPSDQVAVVELQGEVDIYSSRRFEEVLSRGISDGPPRVIIDFAKVTFIDSTALGVMVSGLRSIKARGGTMDIVCPEEAIRGIFETTRLNEVLGIYLSRAEALAAKQ